MCFGTFFFLQHDSGSLRSDVNLRGRDYECAIWKTVPARWQASKTSTYLLRVSSSVKSGSYRSYQLNASRSHSRQRATCDWQLKGLDHSTDVIKPTGVCSGDRHTDGIINKTWGQKKIKKKVELKRLLGDLPDLHFSGLLCVSECVSMWSVHQASYPVCFIFVPSASMVQLLIRWNHSFSSSLLVLSP